VPALVLASIGFCGWRFMLRMPLESYRGPWVPLSPEETALRDALRRDVQVIAGEIGNRNWFVYPRLVEAAAWIAGSLGQTGYKVRRLGYEVRGKTCHNLEVEIPGRTCPEEIVVIGAHYDSVPGCPAANDNGSGVATLLALARAFADAEPERTIRFVAFVNEEPPFYRSSEMGSFVYARECRRRGDRVVAMLSLETIGYYRDERGSQMYPPPFSLFYPSEGNFIAFVGNVSTRAGAAVPRHVSPRGEVPVGRRRAARVHHGHRLVGPLVVLESGVSRGHGDRHGVVSLPVLSLARGYAGEARLRPHGARRCRSGARGARSRRSALRLLSAVRQVPIDLKPQLSRGMPKPRCCVIFLYALEHSEIPDARDQCARVRLPHFAMTPIETRFDAGPVMLNGSLTLPTRASGVVLFAHGSGSSRFSPRNNFVARVLNDAGLGTLLFDLLTEEEEAIDLRTGRLRFDITLLSQRLVAATDWLLSQHGMSGAAIGYFGSSTGGAAALVAAVNRPEAVRAIVCRGSRTDMAARTLTEVTAPTLLVVGEADTDVLAWNRESFAQLRAKKRLEVISGATHLFEEPGTLEEVARLATAWFVDHLQPRMR
jgi:dienelactone hydrolase